MPILNSSKTLIIRPLLGASGAQHEFLVVRRLRENGYDIRAERAREFDAEQLRRASPQRDLGFGQQRARDHADREGRRIEIERDARIEQPRRAAAADLDRPLTMRDVDQRMRRRRQRCLQLGAKPPAFVLGKQQPFVRTQPQRRARARGPLRNGSVGGAAPKRRADAGRGLATAAQDERVAGGQGAARRGGLRGRARSSRTERRTASGIEALAFPVVEDRLDDPRRHRACRRRWRERSRRSGRARPPPAPSQSCAGGSG